ncbi:hypothetical protein, partial [Acinetobacter baumannii]|uniref:hypothetical protein n=1 Tax=Acinetobacter baumannii TaxID=470 RepID=UPI001C06EDFA
VLCGFKVKVLCGLKVNVLCGLKVNVLCGLIINPNPSPKYGRWNSWFIKVGGLYFPFYGRVQIKYPLLLYIRQEQP